ncbi:hypothetical protein JTB14_008626 [Gonioctena quinquepunctata]|nr:hypothetical protein JTB14_008626 [Gonioctena quinquepunctata]
MQISSHSKDEISGRNVFKKGQCNEPRPDLSPPASPSTAMRSSPEIFENHPVPLPRNATVNIGNNWNMPSPTGRIRNIENAVSEINRPPSRGSKQSERAHTIELYSGVVI